jgi:hypothetical protein
VFGSPLLGTTVWSTHVEDPILASNRTQRVDFALFMVHALTDGALVQKTEAMLRHSHTDVV